MSAAGLVAQHSRLPLRRLLLLALVLAASQLAFYVVDDLILKPKAQRNAASAMRPGDGFVATASSLLKAIRSVDEAELDSLMVSPDGVIRATVRHANYSDIDLMADDLRRAGVRLVSEGSREEGVWIVSDIAVKARISNPEARQAAVGSQGRSIAETLLVTSRAAGLTGTEIDTGPTLIQVDVTDASSAEIFGWLNTLERQDGLTPRSLTLLKTGPALSLNAVFSKVRSRA